MVSAFRFFGLILPVGAGLLLCSGCVATSDTRPALALVVDEHGMVAGTGIDAADLWLACTDLQRGLLTVPEIAGSERVMQCLVEPVENDTRLTLNLAALDMAVRAQLASGAPWPCRFVAAPEASAEVDFYVTGRLQRLQADGPDDDGRLLYTLQLIDARNSELVWVGLSELRHQTAAELKPL